MPIKHFTSLVASVLLLVSCSEEPTSVSSTLIINAIIFDGTGADGYDGSVRIDGDRIVAVGDIAALDGETIIDATGLALAPGFIDTHSHHDSNMDEYRHMPGVLSQGVTTIVRGADGFSGTDDAFGFIPQSEFNRTFAAAPAAVNVASYSPHNSIRYRIMGTDSKRGATADEIAAMAALVEADMRDGAVGLATGLEYEPGIFSTTQEIIELAKVAANYGGGYMSHVRDEDDHFMDAVDEVIRIGREAGLPVHISHIKLADRAFWGTTDSVIEVLNNARASGVDITADIYHYQR